MVLKETELKRYDRQIRLKGFGIEGQRRLKNSRVAVVGLGGLGCSISIYLTVAGVGYVRLLDQGKVELTDLNRQILYEEGDIGRNKAEVATEKLKRLNPHVEVEGITIKVDEENVVDLIEGVDVVVDGLDNWNTRLLLNEACVKLNIPYIHGGVWGMYGQVMTILPGEGPCLKCFLKEIPIEEEIIPVVGPIPAIIASIEVLETLKLLLNIGKPLVGRILLFDGLSMRFEELPVYRDKDCPVCSRP